MKNFEIILVLAAMLAFAGCSRAFWGGAATGAGGTATAYELRSRQQMQKVEEDYKSGKIDQKEYDIRRDQIRQGSVAY